MFEVRDDDCMSHHNHNDASSTGAMTLLPCSFCVCDDPGPLRSEASGVSVPCSSSECDGTRALTLVPCRSRECNDVGALTPVPCRSPDCHDASGVLTVVSRINAFCTWQLLVLFLKLVFVVCMVVSVTTACTALHHALSIGVSSAAQSAGSSAGSAIGWGLAQRALPLMWRSSPQSSSGVMPVLTNIFASVSQTPVFREARFSAFSLIQDLIAFTLW
jgi:hypothetical protein